MKSASPVDCGLPHRPPFLFLDEVIALVPGERGEATRHFPADEAFFAGHFPGEPLVPGVILCEAIAQLAGIVAGQPGEGTGWRLTAIRQAKFFRPVLPETTVRFQVEHRGTSGRLAQLEGSAWVADEEAARATVVLSAV